VSEPSAFFFNPVGPASWWESDWLGWRVPHLLTCSSSDCCFLCAASLLRRDDGGVNASASRAE